MRALWLKVFQRFCIAGLVLVLLACAKPVPHHQIRFAIAQAPLTLDPRYATDAASERVNRLLYQPLVDFDEHFRAKPELATWQQLAPTWYRFTLKSSRAKFHDGSTLNAQDVVATYQSLLVLKDAPHGAEFANIAKIKTVDGNTVDFTLRVPDSKFPTKLIIGILPAKLIKQQHDFSHHPLGSGPLKFVSWSRTLMLQRVADGQVIMLEEVKDPTVRVLKLLRGEADLLQGDLPPELVAYLKQQSGVQVLESRGTNYSYLGFNLQDPVLKNPLVRRAVALSINRDAIIRHALVPGTRSATAILPPEHWAGNAGLQPLDYDPAQAKGLLVQAGVELPLKLTLKTSTDVQRVRLATVMQAQMREAGIALEIRSLDWGTFFDDVKQGHFQLYGLTWVGIKTPEIYAKAFHSAFVPPAGANRGRLQDARLDTLIEQSDWPAVTQRVQELLPYVPLWYEGQFAALGKGVHGYQPATDGNWDRLAFVTKQ